MGLGLIVFDCDGVLIDSERLSMRGYQEVLADYGIEVSESLWARCLGRKRADILALIESSAGRSAPAEAADRLWPHIRRLFAAELRATAGLVEFLELSPVRRCVASSSEPGRIRFCLETTGLARYLGTRSSPPRTWRTASRRPTSFSSRRQGWASTPRAWS